MFRHVVGPGGRDVSRDTLRESLLRRATGIDFDFAVHLSDDRFQPNLRATQALERERSSGRLQHVRAPTTALLMSKAGERVRPPRTASYSDIPEKSQACKSEG